MNTGRPLLRWSALLPLFLSVFLFGGGEQANATPEAAGGAGVTVCLAVAALSDVRAIVVVPSGTVFEAPGRIVSRVSGKSPGRKAHAAVMGLAQALVTTETVTLTATEPCAGADAAGVVSATRGWRGPVALPAGHALTLNPAGRISGNGLETGWQEDDETLRALVQAGGLSATAHGRLPQTVRLLESAADRDDADAEAQARAAAQSATPLSADGQRQGAAVSAPGSGLDMSEGAMAADDLPSQRHAR